VAVPAVAVLCLQWQFCTCRNGLFPREVHRFASLTASWLSSKNPD